MLDGSRVFLCWNFNFGHAGGRGTEPAVHTFIATSRHGAMSAYSNGMEDNNLDRVDAVEK